VTINAAAPPIRDGSAVGAGDAFLAGLLAAMEEGAEPPEALRAAVAAGTATLLSDGQDLLRRSDYEALLRTITVRRAG